MKEKLQSCMSLSVNKFLYRDIDVTSLQYHKDDLSILTTILIE